MTVIPLFRNSSSIGIFVTSAPIATINAPIPTISVIRAPMPINAAGPKVPTTDKRISVTDIVMSSNDNADALSIAPFTSSADIMANTKPINARGTTNTVNANIPFKAFLAIGPIIERTTRTPDITISNIESAVAFVIALSTCRADIIANTKPNNAITTLIATMEINEFADILPSLQIIIILADITVNNIDNAVAFTIALFVFSPDIIANTEPNMERIKLIASNETSVFADMFLTLHKMCILAEIIVNNTLNAAAFVIALLVFILDIMPKTAPNIPMTILITTNEMSELPDTFFAFPRISIFMDITVSSTDRPAAFSIALSVLRADIIARTKPNDAMITIIGTRADHRLFAFFIVLNALTSSANVVITSDRHAVATVKEP